MTSHDNGTARQELAPDPGEVARFVAIVFRHADPTGWVNLRAFVEGGDKPAAANHWGALRIEAGVDAIVDAAIDLAAACATAAVPAVFCPPVCTFSDRGAAADGVVANGLAIMIECDKHPREALAKLVAILGPATVVVASGGVWQNGGEAEDKLHAYWVLSAPTRAAEEHARLREARNLASRIAGSDASASPLCHPLRWPGSWHRKAEPRLARIVGGDAEREVDLDDALGKLRAAAGEGRRRPERRAIDDVQPADLSLLRSALASIPNDDLDWNEWNSMGLRIFAATGGAEEGRALFRAWSARCPEKHERGETIDRAWARFRGCPPDRTGAEKVYALARAAGWRPPGARLEDFYAYLPQHNYMFVPTRSLWPAESVNSLLQKTDGLRPARWLDKNRHVEQMTWSPGEPAIVRDRLLLDGGWVDHPGMSGFNLYLPPPLAGDPDEAGRWVDHVRYVYPEDAEHIFDFLAHRVQWPGEKVNHALVLGGAGGIGKDTALEPLKRAVGHWNFKEVSPDEVMGRFNGFVKSVVLRVSEARDLGDHNRFEFYDHMKRYVAAPPDVLPVDEKNLKVHYVLNVCGVIVTTNYAEDGMYLPPDDRRHYVAWSERKMEDERFAGDYWKDLWDWYGGGGIGHVAAWLRERDLSTFDPKAPPVKTRAFWRIANANRSSEEGELADALDRLGNPDAVIVDQVREQADTGFKEWLDDRKNSKAVARRFASCGYVAVPNPDNAEGRWKIYFRGRTIYAKQALSVNQQLDAAKKLKDDREKEERANNPLNQDDEPLGKV